MVRPKLTVCSVHGCYSASNDSSLNFFGFPRTEKVCLEWIYFCQNRQVRGVFEQRGTVALSHRKVCSKHFSRSAYQNCQKERLLRGAVPSLLGPPAATAGASQSSLVRPPRHTASPPPTPPPGTLPSTFPSAQEPPSTQPVLRVLLVRSISTSAKVSCSYGDGGRLPSSADAANGSHDTSGGFLQLPPPPTWSSLRQFDPPVQDLPTDPEVMQLALAVRAAVLGGKFSDRREADLLLNVASAWEQLPFVTKAHVYGRLRILGATGQHGSQQLPMVPSEFINTEAEEGTSHDVATSEVPSEFINTELAEGTSDVGETSEVPSEFINTEPEEGTSHVGATSEVPSEFINTEPEEGTSHVGATSEVPSEFINTEPEEGTSHVGATSEADLDPANLEEEETTTGDIHPQADLDPASPEEEEAVTGDIPPEIRKSSTAFPLMEFLASRQKRTPCESYGAYQDVKNCVNDDGKPSSKRRENVADDANPSENVKSSGSAKVKVRKTDVKVRRDCEPSGEREGGNEAPLQLNEGEVKRKRYLCNHCGKGFQRKGNLKRHLGMYCYEANWDVCNKRRNFKGNRRSARETSDSREGPKEETPDKVTRVRRINKFFCDSCGVGCTCISQMKIHLRVHSGEKPFPCTVCGKRFSIKYALGTHMKIHTGAKPYLCEVCARQFAHDTSLKIHRRIHSGEKPYACDVCGRQFTQRGNLANHRRTHSGELPYGCDVCGEKFIQRNSLVCHRLIHSGVTPYVCRICNNCYIDGSSLRHHLRMHSQKIL